MITFNRSADPHSLDIVRDGQEIGLQFHNNRTKGLSLYNCRGQRCFSARKLNNNSWVAKISSLPPNQRHFKVTYNKVKKMLVIDLKNT